MTPEELAEIKARAEAATPGPWIVSDYMDMGQPGIISRTNEIVIGCSSRYRQHNGPANLEAIAAARSDVPALVAEVERLRAGLALLQVAALGDAKRHELARMIGDLLEAPGAD